MTVYESLALWLNGILGDPRNAFEGAPAVIDIELLPDGNLPGTALFSNPDDACVQLAGGRVRHTDTKTLYIKRNFAEHSDRLANEEFMEKLKRCIHQKTLRGIYPNDGRKWRRIEIEGSVFPGQKAQDNSTAIYQAAIRLVYEDPLYLQAENAFPADLPDSSSSFITEENEYITDENERHLTG